MTRDDIVRIHGNPSVRPFTHRDSLPKNGCPICGESMGNKVIVVAEFRGKKFQDVHQECAQ